MSVYRLTQKAEDDIIRIHAEGIRMFGAKQAWQYHDELEKVFRILAENPKIGRERHEILPPVRIHPHKAHVIVYLIDASGVLIVRVRHAHEDWAEDAQ